MGWSPLTTILAVLGGWVALALIVAWGWSRWHQWLRGDFDPPDNWRH